MRWLARLEYERKSGAVQRTIFRQLRRRVSPAAVSGMIEHGDLDLIHALQLASRPTDGVLMH